MKLKEYIKKINIPMVCLTAFVVRIVVLGASVGDSIALVGLASLFGFAIYLNRKDTSWKEIIERELQKVKQELQSNRLNNNIIRKSNEAKKPEEGKRWF